jgi:PAS domain S-box-containing protein/putative nucleotidyltransferase with HDIG domain
MRDSRPKNPFYTPVVMRLPYVIKKTRPDTDDTDGVGVQGEIPLEIGSEIHDLRRRISEFQAAAVRERRSEEILRASEERFRKIFEEGPLSMAMSDPFFRFIRANAAFCRMLGYTEKEITSLTFKDITHPDHVAGDAEAITKLLKGDIPFYRTEKRYVRKNQEIVWGQVTVSAIRDADGRFQHFLAMVEDITAGKQAYAELVQSEQKSKELADALPSGIFETDLDGHLLFANRTAYEWLGYAAEDFKAGLSIVDFLIEKDRARAGENFRRVLNAGELSSGEYTAKRKDGLTFPVLITARTIIKNGRPTGLLGTVMDISERRRAEKELRENEEKYRMLFESANDAIFLMDTDQFVDCNSNTLDIFGCGRKEDIVGHPPWDFSPAWQPDGRESKDKAQGFIAAALGGKPQRFFWLHCRRDGTPFDAEVSLTSLVLGGKTHLLAVVRDITDRTQADRLQNAVYQIAQAADESADLNDLYKSVHETVRTVMPAGNFYIALYDPAAELISFPYFVDEVDAQPAPVKPRKGLTEYVIRTGKPLLCDEATDMELRGRSEVEVLGAPSAIWLGVPLIVDKKTIGAMVVQHYSDPGAYGPRELRMLEYVSSQVAKSIEHKRTEEALRKNEQRLSLHIQQTPLGVIEWDTGFRVLQWNRADERIFGYTAAEAIGRHADFIVPERFREPVNQVWGDLLARKGGERSTNENTTKDGRTIFCEWYNTSLVDSEGRVIGVASLVQDVTERRRVEEALRDSEEFHRKLLSSMPDMIIRTDLDGKILFANDVAVRSGGFADVTGLVGRSIFSFVSPEDQERAVATTKIMFEKRIGPQEYQLVFNGGKGILYEINGTVLRNPDRAPYGMVFLCRDITDRKQAEADVHQSLKKLRSTLKASIDSLASAIEMRDPYTAGHQERVTRLATAIAREMHLDEERIEGIQIAGIIHDIGKLYVPAEILSKPTKLNELEYSMIKMHAQVGFTILSKIDFPWPIAQIVHQHHENVNGSGYPQGLAGKDILLEAKILCVADVVEAMSSHRPYRPALGIQAALEEISLKRGILYDREVVDACLRIFSDKNFKFD